MSNNSPDAASHARGRQRNRSHSPLSQTYSRTPSGSSLESETDQGSSTNSSPVPPQSKRHRRKASRIEDVSELSLDLKSLSFSEAQSLDSDQPLPPTPNPPTPPPKPHDSLQPAPLKIKKKPLKSKPQLALDTMQLSNPRAVRLLIASIGNPKPYHSTRHSAGHHLLQAFASKFQFPPLVKNKTGGLLASGADVGFPQYTLWQSNAVMNVSGISLLKAWKSFTAEHPESDNITGLVVLHDELESQPAKLVVRKGATSSKGHNGIKSIQTSFQGGGLLGSLGEKRFVKVAIGIGRPQSRDKDVVSGYVLGQLTGKEKMDIANKAGELAEILEREFANLEGV